MRPREDFVGTILDGEYVLVEFLGEGVVGVVYAVATVDAPNVRNSVLKFFKPVPFLEMDTLHYSLRVDIERYPNHPMLLTPGERLKRLSDEMFDRISSSGCEFRVNLYQTLMKAAIQGTALIYGSLYEEGRLPSDFLGSDEALRRRVDKNFLGRVKELLEEDSIQESYVPFMEHLVESIERAIVEWRDAGTFCPFSDILLYNLLGLWIEGFINDEELEHIAADQRLVTNTSMDAIEGLWVFATILYHWASDHLEQARKNVGNLSVDADSDEPRDKIPTKEIGACVHACRLVAGFAGSNRLRNERLHGLAEYWRGKALLLLPERGLEACQALELALPKLKNANCLGDLHDLLVDLAILKKTSSPEDAVRHFQDSMAIRRRLGVDVTQEAVVTPQNP
jgi:hypothetical protein